MSDDFGPEFRSAAQSLTDWLTKDALPLWWEKGADHKVGGFYELLSQSGEPVIVDRRARVQARQIYVYATAGKLGWTGPWRDAVEHGLDFFIGRYRLPNGLFRTLVHADGSAADDTVWLYDQAFALLALAEASVGLPARAPDCRAMARALVDALSALRLPMGGFTEASPLHPYQSNPHMHLLEACLAWMAIDEDPIWADLAGEIIELALTRFIDPAGGLHEFFAEDWSFEPTQAGRIVEPGHQFEWAWLLQRWAQLRGRDDAGQASRRLFEIGKTYGVDRLRGVAFDQMLDDFSAHEAGARLWPQTERIKAAVIRTRFAQTPEEKRDGAREGLAAIQGLKLYLDVPLKGLWRDKMKADGTFVDEPAPASSFYHIVCAISELKVALDPAWTRGRT